MKTYETQAAHPLYARWRHMRAACYQQSCPDYQRVGARGIQMQRNWNNFWNFAADIEEKLGLPPHLDSKLFRLDQSKDFTLKNLGWGTSKDIGTRFSKVKKLRYKNKTQTIRQWSEQTGISTGTLMSRIRLGWDAAQTLGLKPGPRQSKSKRTVL